MKILFSVLLFSYLSCVLYANSQVDEATPSDALPQNTHIGEDWILNFSDEFNGTAVNPAKWNIDDGNKSRAARPKLGIDYWMWKASNVWLADGDLVLQVTKASANTMHCGSIHSHQKYETRYGYFEARIKIAEAAKGTHTAFWLQGPNMSNVDGTANDGAEIDIFESAWLGDYTKSVVHIDGYGANHKANTKQYSTPGIHSGYHTFGLHWTEDFMKIYYDGVLKVTYSADEWVVRADEFLWLSDGASFGFEGDHFTKQEIGVLTAAYVDYVRVWKPQGAASSVISNSDFEENPETNKWFKSRSDIELYKSLKPFYKADYCKLPDADNERGILQTVSVEPGQAYEFTLTGRIQNSDQLIVDENNHASKGPATLMAELKVSGETILDLNIQSNKDTTVVKQIMIPTDVDKVLVKVSKNWNIAFVDHVYLNRIRLLAIPQRSMSELRIKCYPNPCQQGQELHVESDVLIDSYQVLSLAGAVLAQAQVDAHQYTIPSSSIDQGVNFLYLKLKSGRTIAKKLVVY